MCYNSPTGVHWFISCIRMSSGLDIGLQACQLQMFIGLLLTARDPLFIRHCFTAISDFMDSLNFLSAIIKLQI